MEKKIVIFLVIIFNMMVGCIQMPVELKPNSSLQNTSLSEEAQNVLDGWIYNNDCFDGSYSLCKFNLDGEVIKLTDDVPETIVIDNNWIYYSTMLDDEDTLKIYKIKPDGTGRQKIVENMVYPSTFNVYDGCIYYFQGFYIPGSEEGFYRIKTDGTNAQKIGSADLFRIYNNMVYYSYTNERFENFIC